MSAAERPQRMAVGAHSSRVSDMKPHPTSAALGIALGIAAVIVASAASPAHADSFWVGNGGAPPCTHAALQAAIDASLGTAGGDTIYLVGPGPFSGPFHVTSGPLTIVGNVGSCGSATSVGHATLRMGSSGGRPLTVMAGANQTVRLHRLVVTTENGTYSGDGGAISFSGGANSSRLELYDTRVEASNATGNGGGIHLSGGRVVVGERALVSNNGATFGGGIAAVDGGAVEVEGGSVEANTALLDGGGIWVGDEDGSVLLGSMASQLPSTVAGNLAGRDGGGLYLAGANQSFITSIEGRPPVAITANQAQRGGGLFIDGSPLALDNAVVEQNQATAEGGGIFVGDGGSLVSNTLFVPTRGGFPRFEANAAATGSALHVDHGAVVLASGRIHGHADGDAPLVSSLSGVLFLHGLTIDGNAASSLFRVDSVVLTLEHLSLVGNQVDGILGWRGGQAEITVSALALDETEPFFASSAPLAGPPVVSCVVTRHASTFAVVPAGTVLDNLLVADPQFVAPPHELHLRHGSPAIDRCFAHPRLDLDGDERAHDDPYHPNEPDRTADAGADESTVIFIDGFESGGTGPWSGEWP